MGDIVNFENLAITVKKMYHTVVEKAEVLVVAEQEEESEKIGLLKRKSQEDGE